MAEPAGGGGADPQAALQKYNYPGADKDDAIIAKVEGQIANSPMGKFQKWLGDKPPVDQSEVDAKKGEYSAKIEQAKKDHPDEAKKAGEPPPLVSGAASKPEIKEPQKQGPAPAPKDHTTAGQAPPKKAAAAGDQKPKEAPKENGEAKDAKPIAFAMAGMSAGEMDKFLNEYPNKSKETTDKLAKIKQLQGIASGFEGKMEKYVSDGSVLDGMKGAAINFLGKKELDAVFGDNPYAKIGGGLGKIMQGLSVFKNIVGIVGNVCTKIGLVLTIVGLLGMIFPPVGAAVEGVARVLNVIGIICDAIGFVLAGILTGLNGVVLAQQIAKGGSNEEKAASADLMMSEANDASGHLMNLAMTYGPKFMKGFLGESKGAIGAFIKNVKGKIGKIIGGVTGPVKNWAKKGLYKLGFGLEKGAGPGVMSKIWSSPGKAIEKLQNTNIVKKINESKFMQGLEKKGVSMGQWADKFDQNVAERLGAGAGAKVAPGMAGKLTDMAKKDEETAVRDAERLAGEDLANQERKRIERDVSSKRDTGNNELEKGNAARSDRYYDEADQLEKGEKKAVDDARKEGRAAAHEENKEKRSQDRSKENNAENYQKNPDGFKKYTHRLEHDREKLEEKLATASEGEKAGLERQIKSLDERIKNREYTPAAIASGNKEYEPYPETLWDLKNKAQEVVQAGKELNGTADPSTDSQAITELVKEGKWKPSMTEISAKRSEQLMGKPDREQYEAEERHDQINEIGEDTAAQVDSMLSGVGGESPHVDEKKDEGAPQGGFPQHTDSVAGNGKEPGGATGQPHGPAPSSAMPPQGSDQPTGEGAGNQKEEDPNLPPLLYWPKLLTDDFPKALEDIKKMKETGARFKRAQTEAKKKALDTAALFGKFEEHSKQKSDLADKHKAAVAKTKDEAGTAGQAAQQGDAHAGEGKAKQDEAGSTSQGEQPHPDPGPKPGGIFAIFKRILWEMKKWVCDKAAAVFGWIQEKIASLILQGLCGVSMGDLKSYTEALHHRMDFSKGVAVTAEGTSDTVKGKEKQAGADAKNHGEEALKDAKECDRNMADSDQFVSDLSATEQDISAETQKAGQFITQLKAEADAEKQRKEAEAKKKQEEAQKRAQAQQGPTGPSATPGPAPTPLAQGDPKKDNSDKGKKPEVTAGDQAKIKTAAGFVVTRIPVYLHHLEDQRERGTEKMSAKAKAWHLSSFTTLKVGDTVLSSYRQSTDKIKAQMEGLRGAQVNTGDAAQHAVEEIKEGAKSLDEATESAHKGLNASFKAAYEAMSRAKRQADMPQMGPAAGAAPQ